MIDIALLLEKIVGKMPVHHLRCWAGIQPTKHTRHSSGPIVVPSDYSTQPTLLTLRWYDAGLLSAGVKPATCA